MDTLSSFLPIDRRHALARGESLPDRAVGAVLFADLAGFTPLTESLVRAFGAQRGVEELTRRLNRVYEALITTVHHYGGSVVSFSGDAITCWFDADPGRRATACALALQAAMPAAGGPALPAGPPLALKVAVAAGPVRRFLIGNPEIQVLDILAGATLDRGAAAEQVAAQGEVVLDAPTVAQAGAVIQVAEWREAPEGDARYAVVGGMAATVPPLPWPPLPAAAFAAEQVRPWVLPAVYDRLRGGQGEFLAELRPVVSLFLRFSGLDYDRDPAAGARLDAYIRWVQAVLAQHAGVLLEVPMGDKGGYLYATFGAPLAHEDDPARALAAALELRTPPPAFHWVSAAQIGISQGRMHAGAYGAAARRTYGVLGDEVNVAARLMMGAAPGQILASGAVAQATARRFQATRLGPLTIKGRQEPVTVWAVTGARPTPVQGPAPLGPHPLVGREAELAQIGRLLAAARAGQGSILRLEGAAGMGKSSLVAAMIDQALADGMQVALGTCQSTTQGTAYAPWRQALRGLLGLADDAGPTAAGSLAGLTGGGAAGESAPPVLLPVLGDLLGLPFRDNATTAAFDPPARQHALFALVGALLERRAHEHPLLVVLEDIHWIDDASLDLILGLGRTLAAWPLILVLVQRSADEADQGLAARLADLPAPHHLVLEELPHAAVATLVSRYLGGPLGPHALALIAERSQGNPFFVEELVDALRESRRLVRDADGLWDLPPEPGAGAGGRGAGGDMDLPDSVQGIVLSRLDRLPETHKLTLKVASVIGRVFALQTLSYAHPQHPGAAELQAEIANMAARDFIRLETPPPDISYLFKHNITQEVAYATLLADQRRPLHRAVAEWYEATYAATPDAPPLSPFYPLLVYHWHEADVPAREQHYATLAGEQAAAQFAQEDALAYLGRALELAAPADYAARYRLLLAREAVLHLRGDRVAQAADLAALETLVAAWPDPGRQATVALRRALAAEATGDYPAAIAAAQQTVLGAGEAGDPALETEGYLRWGHARWRQADFVEARRLLGQALALARAGGHTHNEAQSLRSLGQVYFYQGDYPAALAHTQQAQAIFHRHGDRHGEARTLNTLGAIRYQLGDLTAARARYQEAVGYYHSVGDRHGEALVLYNLGITACDLGEYETARDSYARVLPIYREIGDRQMEGGVLDSRGSLYYLLGDYAAASRDCTEALAIRRAIGQRNAEAFTLGNLALIREATHEYAAARDLAAEALALSREIGARAFMGAILTTLGHALAGLGDHPGAAAAYREALDLQRALDHQGPAHDALAGLAALALAEGDLAQAQALVEEILAWLATHEVGVLIEPFRVYLTCVRVLQGADPTGAAAAPVLAAARALIATRAAGIHDAELRRHLLDSPVARALQAEVPAAGA